MLIDKINNWAALYSLSPSAVNHLIKVLSPEINVTPGATSEAATQNSIRLKAPEYEGFLWRNNNGASKVIEDNGQTRFIRYGLANDSKQLNENFKSSDLIGVIPVPIQQRHVGQTFGLFVCIETKKPNWTLKPSDKRGNAQLNFINTVNMCGGLGMFATHENHLNEGLRKWLD